MATPITLDYKDFLAGESQWDYISDRGFSPDSKGLNLFLKPGVLNFGWDATDRGSTTLTGNILASAYDKDITGNDTYHLDDEGAFYTLDDTTFTKRQTVTADTFVLGTSDLIQFRGDLYATSETRVIQLGGSDLTTVDSSWWTGLATGVRHPLEVVEDKLYIGSQNIIYSYDGTTTTTAVTLPTDCNITSLRRHPDGRHLIAFTGFGFNFSHDRGDSGRIYIVNKDTLTWEREILTETQVEGSRNVGGIIFVTYGKKLGYFTGSGIKFLKQLKTSATTYSQCLTNMEDILIVRDGLNALAYGNLGNGSLTWHNFAVADRNINNIIYKGSGKVLIAFSDGAGAGILREYDSNTAESPGGQTTILYTKRYNFGQTVKIRRIEFIHDQKATGSILSFTVSYRDTDDAETTIQSVSYPAGPIISKTRIEADITTDVFQMKIVPSNGTLALKSIRIYYDPII